jgi:hypothetical protein
LQALLLGAALSCSTQAFGQTQTPFVGAYTVDETYEMAAALLNIARGKAIKGEKESQAASFNAAQFLGYVGATMDAYSGVRGLGTCRQRLKPYVVAVEVAKLFEAIPKEQAVTGYRMVVASVTAVCNQTDEKSKAPGS